MSVTLRSKIVEIEAEQWTGSNTKKILDFCKDNPVEFDYKETHFELRIWNELEMQFINVPLGHWVLRGLKGEYYPCEEEALLMKYDIIENETD